MESRSLTRGDAGFASILSIDLYTIVPSGATPWTQHGGMATTLRGPKALWSAADVAEYLGVSRRTCYTLRQAVDFPPAIHLSERVVRWRPEQVRAWADRREARGRPVRR